MKLTRKSSLIFLTLLALLTLSLFGLSFLKPVSANATSGADAFVMEEAASIKVSVKDQQADQDLSGIRFRVKMGENVKNNIVNNANVTLGVIVFPQSFIADMQLDGTEDFLETGVLSKYISIPIDENKIYEENGDFYANACVTNIIIQKNFGREYIALAYTDTDGVRDWADFNQQFKRSMYDVANVASLVSPDRLEDIKTTYDVFGTTQYPITIGSAKDYEMLSANVAEGFTYEGFNFKVTDNFTLNAGYTPLAEEFAGTIDGNGKTVYLENKGETVVFAQNSSCVSNLTSQPVLAPVFKANAENASYVGNSKSWDGSTEKGSYVAKADLPSPDSYSQDGAVLIGQPNQINTVYVQLAYNKTQLENLKTLGYTHLQLSVCIYREADASYVTLTDGLIFRHLGDADKKVDKKTWLTYEITIDNVIAEMEEVAGSKNEILLYKINNNSYIYVSSFMPIVSEPDPALFVNNTACVENNVDFSADSTKSLLDNNQLISDVPNAQNNYSGSAVYVNNVNTLYMKLDYNTTELSELKTKGYSHLQFNFAFYHASLGAYSNEGLLFRYNNNTKINVKTDFNNSAYKDWIKIDVAIDDVIAEINAAGTTDSNILLIGKFYNSACTEARGIQIWVGDVTLVKPAN